MIVSGFQDRLSNTDLEDLEILFALMDVNADYKQMEKCQITTGLALAEIDNMLDLQTYTGIVAVQH